MGCCTSHSDVATLNTYLSENFDTVLPEDLKAAIKLTALANLRLHYNVDNTRIVNEYYYEYFSATMKSSPHVHTKVLIKVWNQPNLNQYRSQSFVNEVKILSYLQTTTKIGSNDSLIEY